MSVICTKEMELEVGLGHWVETNHFDICSSAITRTITRTATSLTIHYVSGPGYNVLAPNPCTQCPGAPSDYWFYDAFEYQMHAMADMTLRMRTVWNLDSDVYQRLSGATCLPVLIENGQTMIQGATYVNTVLTGDTGFKITPLNGSLSGAQNLDNVLHAGDDFIGYAFFWSKTGGSVVSQVQFFISVL